MCLFVVQESFLRNTYIHIYTYIHTYIHTEYVSILTGHQRYMREIDSSVCVGDVESYRRNVSDSPSGHVCLCGIPGVSQVKPLEFLDGVDSGQQCSQFKWGCTQPLY